MTPSYWTIEQLPGLSNQEEIQLKSHGIVTTKHLLEKGKNSLAKQSLANQLKINVKYVNKWVALADLARLPSVGCQYCGLLLHAGIISVSQLNETPVDKLHRQILRLQVATFHRQDLCPPIELVQQWIKEAQSLGKK
jgi:hypothetical protein